MSKVNAVMAGIEIKKKDMQTDTVYWSKKKGGAKFNMLIKIGGSVPFLKILKVVLVEANGNPLETGIDIDDLEDSFYDANWPKI